uniref:Uncharacterized protein n=1 Tax=Pseudomonas aeruginosa TaxID=287 RepID=A0A2L1KF49_PSEAI|nr:Hypothetical protein [Pseudomonas aeruginosa]
MNSLPEQKIQGGTVTLHVPFLGLAQWQAGLFPDASSWGDQPACANRSFNLECSQCQPLATPCQACPW